MDELTDADRGHLLRCVELAREALDAGDEPFGSVLADADGTALAEGRNRVVETGDARSTRSSSSPGGRLPTSRPKGGPAPGAPAPPVLPLSVQQVAPGVVVQGPADDLAEQVRELQLEHSRASAAEGRRSGRRDALCQQRQVRRVVGVELGADGRHLRTHPGQQHLVHVLEHCRDGAFLCAPGGAGALVRRLPGQRQQEAAEPGVLLLRLLFIP